MYLKHHKLSIGQRFLKLVIISVTEDKIRQSSPLLPCLFCSRHYKLSVDQRFLRLIIVRATERRIRHLPLLARATYYSAQQMLDGSRYYTNYIGVSKMKLGTLARLFAVPAARVETPSAGPGPPGAEPQDPHHAPGGSRPHQKLWLVLSVA